jgi:hypothetical protein
VGVPLRMLTADNNTDESRMKCEFIFVTFCIMKHFPAVLRIDADPDPNFVCNVDPDLDPALHQSDAIMRPLVQRPSTAPF